MLYGYGGFPICSTRRFGRLAVVARPSGVPAVARFAAAASPAASGTTPGASRTKPNCFDDFAACADHLVQTRVTSRERLGIMGGSNGGLLMGAVLTQRPDIAAAVVSAVPVLDMLRTELTPNGAFVMAEFGSVRDPELCRVLSPTRHTTTSSTARPIRRWCILPPHVGTRASRAYGAKKMVARLEAATSSDQPILLRMESGGHGIGQSLNRRSDGH